MLRWPQPGGWWQGKSAQMIADPETSNVMGADSHLKERPTPADLNHG